MPIKKLIKNLQGSNKLQGIINPHFYKDLLLQLYFSERCHSKIIYFLLFFKIIQLDKKYKTQIYAFVSTAIKCSQL